MVQEVVVFFFLRLLSVINILVRILSAQPFVSCHRSQLSGLLRVVHDLFILILFKHRLSGLLLLVLCAESSGELFEEPSVFVIDAVAASHEVVDSFLPVSILRLAWCENIILLLKEELRGCLLASAARLVLLRRAEFKGLIKALLRLSAPDW